MVRAGFTLSALGNTELSQMYEGAAIGGHHRTVAALTHAGRPDDVGVPLG